MVVGWNPVAIISNSFFLELAMDYNIIYGKIKSPYEFISTFANADFCVYHNTSLLIGKFSNNQQCRTKYLEQNRVIQ